MTKYYYRVSSRDRIGNRTEMFFIDEAQNKTQIRNYNKKMGLKVEAIYTEEELATLPERSQELYRRGY